jgi:hypothetical protein
MKCLLPHYSQCVLALCLTVGLSACDGQDQPQSTGPDASAVAGASESTKSICEEVCSAADQIQSQACGETEFATHSECYVQCVSRYLDYPNCKDDFDDSNECVRDAVCNAQTECKGAVVFAAACMQVS